MGTSSVDIELIQGCINNNRKAQEKLYKQFFGPMLSICTRYTRNEPDAMEALHNGFLKVYKNIHAFDYTKASLYTWIRTIMVNTSIDFVRQFHKHAPAFELDAMIEPSVDGEVLKKLEAGELLYLIRQLPPATQSVFNLYVIEGYTHREIGEKMGISEGTSKWHLSEARKSLQKSIKTLSVA